MKNANNRVGRPPSNNPRDLVVKVRLTEAEYLEAMRLAQLDGISVSEAIRRPLSRTRDAVLRALAEDSASTFESRSFVRGVRA